MIYDASCMVFSCANSSLYKKVRPSVRLSARPSAPPYQKRIAVASDSRYRPCCEAICTRAQLNVHQIHDDKKWSLSMLH